MGAEGGVGAEGGEGIHLPPPSFLLTPLKWGGVVVAAGKGQGKGGLTGDSAFPLKL